MARIDALFKAMVEAGASDLHLVAGQKPIVRIHGQIERFEGHNELENFPLRTMLYEITPDGRKEDFEKTGDALFSYDLPEMGRVRATLFQQKHGCAGAFRLIPSSIQSIEQLGLPAILTRVAMLRSGLVLIAGLAGSGKSTTLAAMIDYANQHRKGHIITIEEPIEFVHQSQGSIVNHREVGHHTQSFAAGLKAALREDPDIILVGEMRDQQTIRLAIETALTGRLVFGTLHLRNVAMAVERLIEAFPYEEQEQIRNALSASLKILVTQDLFNRSDEKGRCAALEVVVCSPAVSSLIREGKTDQISSTIKPDKALGTQRLDDSILDLVNKKWISAEEAYEKCREKARFKPFLTTAPDELV